MAVLLGSFATMIDAGVPVYRALHHLGLNAESPQAGQLCQAMVVDVGRGRALSRAAAQHPQSFSPIQVGLLRVGEETGCLDDVLRRLAAFEEKSQAVQMKLRSALAYPAMLFALCMIGLALAPPLLLEPIFALIRDLHAEVPWITACLMQFSAAMRSPWPYLILGLTLGGARLYLLPYLKRREVQLQLTRRALRIPRLGELVRGVLTTRFARALALQLQAGVPVLDAVFLSGQVAGNPYLEEVAGQVIQSLTRGKSLSFALKNSRFFSPLFTSIVMVGEETGDIPKLVEWLADLGEAETDHALETVSALLEPLVMLVMGIGVATMVLGTLLPLSKALEAI